MDEHLHDELAAWFEFYRDLGIEDFYRRPPGSDRTERQEHQVSEAPSASFEVSQQEPEAPGDERRSRDSVSLVAGAPVQSPSADSRPFQRTPAHALNLFEAPPPVPAGRETLADILRDLGDCQRCKLAGGRHNIVFGQGNPHAELVFVGEGPGADEDAQGLPFVGRAGKLLTQMIEAMGLQRKDVYICNVVKCRPPENRTPEEDEITTCSPFLLRQIDVIAPKVIVCLGAVAAKTLLQTNRGISQFRGEWLEFRGRKLLATYHPAYLLRNPPAKSEVWKDLQKVMAVLGLEVKKGKSS